MKRQEIINSLMRKYTKNVTMIDDDKLMVREGITCGVFSISANKIVVPVKFTAIYMLNDDKFKVCENGIWGVFSFKTKDIVVPMKFIGIEMLDDDKYAVRMNILWGVFSIKEDGLLEPMDYEKISVEGSVVVLSKKVVTTTKRPLFSAEWR